MRAPIFVSLVVVIVFCVTFVVVHPVDVRPVDV
jgi:hypothetical protein